MPVIAFDPYMRAMDVDYRTTLTEQILQQKMQKMHAVYSQQILNRTIKTNTTAQAHQQETLEWAKFAMWLRGFLGALEGKELTAEDVSKVMDKLATVDPESQNWKFDQVNPQAYPPQPMPPINPVKPWGTPIGGPHWTYRGSTTNAEEIERLKAFVEAQAAEQTISASSGTGGTNDAK